ncbi:MAG: hypothetical protein KatS3mg076_0640 [Candidatus Binatia bacterium]|nr:MAG: hypothetical protein KatS3mg076_0640 [Candidatus Binatia bacterium]
MRPIRYHVTAVVAATLALGTLAGCASHRKHHDELVARVESAANKAEAAANKAEAAAKAAADAASRAEAAAAKAEALFAKSVRK